MTTETITWIPVAERLPDDDQTVLQTAPGCPVGLGYFIDGVWYCAEGMPYSDGEVTHWAHMPKGPK